MNLATLIEQFLQSCCAQGKSHHTIRCYSQNLVEFVQDVGNIEMMEFTPELIERHVASFSERLVAGRAISRQTVLKRFTIIRVLVHWAFHQRLMETCITDLVRQPRVDDKNLEALTNRQIQQIFASLKHQPTEWLIFSIFLNTGIRLEELVNIQLQDIDNKFIKVKGKGGDVGTVPISVKLKKEINEYIQNYRKAIPGEMQLITDENGYPLSRTRIQSMVGRMIREVGIFEKAGPHLLRHTFATQYLRRGGNLESLRKILRHRNITTTLKYTHLTNEDVREDYLRVMSK